MRTNCVLKWDFWFSFSSVFILRIVFIYIPIKTTLKWYVCFYSLVFFSFSTIKSVKNTIRLDNYQCIHFTSSGLWTIYDLQPEPLIVGNNLVKNWYLFIEHQQALFIFTLWTKCFFFKFCPKILFAFPIMRILNIHNRDGKWTHGGWNLFIFDEWYFG